MKVSARLRKPKLESFSHKSTYYVPQVGFWVSNLPWCCQSQCFCTIGGFPRWVFTLESKVRVAQLTVYTVPTGTYLGT